MNQLAMYLYQTVDDNMLETSIKTLRKHNDKVHIVLLTDGISGSLESRLRKLYGARIINMASMLNCRMQRKILATCDYLKTMELYDVATIFDADLIFTGDPFNAFNEFEFDIGITLRNYFHFFPLNLGVIYYDLRKNRHGMMQFFDYICDCVTEPIQGHLKEYMRRWQHNHWGVDWWIDQDLFCILWNQKEVLVKKKFGLTMADIGMKYNLCTKRLSDKGRQAMVDAIQAGAANTYHLRGRLKDLLYDGIIPEAVTCHTKPDFSDWAQKK